MYILKKYENYFLVRENQKPFIIFRRVSPSVFCLLFFVVVVLLFVFLEGGRGGGGKLGKKKERQLKYETTIQTPSSRSRLVKNASQDCDMI